MKGFYQINTEAVSGPFKDSEGVIVTDAGDERASRHTGASRLAEVEKALTKAKIEFVRRH